MKGFLTSQYDRRAWITCRNVGDVEIPSQSVCQPVGAIIENGDTILDVTLPTGSEGYIPVINGLQAMKPDKQQRYRCQLPFEPVWIKRQFPLDSNGNPAEVDPSASWGPVSGDGRLQYARNNFIRIADDPRVENPQDSDVALFVYQRTDFCVPDSKIFLINIIPRATSYTDNSGRYAEDIARWAYHRLELESDLPGTKVRMGLVEPWVDGFSGEDPLSYDSTVGLPPDTDRTAIDYLKLPDPDVSNDRRVPLLASDLVTMFETMRTTPDDGAFAEGPDSCIFAYARDSQANNENITAAVVDAMTTLKTQYPETNFVAKYTAFQWLGTAITRINDFLCRKHYGGRVVKGFEIGDDF